MPLDLVEVPGLACPPAFAGAPAFPGSRDPKKPLAGAALVAPNRLTRRDAKRRLLDATAAANAVRELGSLPARGESLHVVMRGNFHFWSIVPAVVALARPARVEVLHVATLGTNKANTASLCALLDAGDVRRCVFLASCYFRDASASIWGDLKAALAERGHRAAAVRNHAKVILFKLDDGRAIAVEGSANLRSCNNLEQFAMTADEDLRAFHARWIDEAVAGDRGAHAA